MTQLWTYLLVVLALVVGGPVELEAASSGTEPDVCAVSRAGQAVRLSKRVDSRDRAGRDGWHADAPELATSAIPGLAIDDVCIVRSRIAAHVGTDLGQWSAIRHGSRAPPRA